LCLYDARRTSLTCSHNFLSLPLHDIIIVDARRSHILISLSLSQPRVCKRLTESVYALHPRKIEMSSTTSGQDHTPSSFLFTQLPNPWDPSGQPTTGLCLLCAPVLPLCRLSVLVLNLGSLLLRLIDLVVLRTRLLLTAPTCHRSRL